MIDIEETKIGVHALLVAPGGKIILQQRDVKPGIMNPGLISMFGGTIKEGETLEDGLSRELEEELGLNIKKYSVKKLGTFYKTKELDGVDWEVNAYLVKEVSPKELTVNEGKGFVCDFSEKLITREKLTRITRLALEKYIEDLKKETAF